MSEAGGGKEELDSFEPVAGADRALRRRLDLHGEFMLAVLPTLTVLAVLALVELVTEQRLLFGLALGITGVLVVLERSALWILARYPDAATSR